jgi:DNA-directed RNA polymerase sigma subunit (sigma70/sigma32)
MAQLSASVGEQQTAKQRADKAYRARLVADGICVKCARRPAQGSQRCHICTAKAAQAQWKRRQGQEDKAQGPKPSIVGRNFATDDLITDHMRLAKALAWKAKAKIPASSSVDVDDMIGDAMLGLVVAGRTFDDSYKVPFGAWATTQIRGAIWGGVRRWNGTGKSRPKFVAELQDWDGAA